MDITRMALYDSPEYNEVQVRLGESKVPFDLLPGDYYCNFRQGIPEGRVIIVLANGDVFNGDFIGNRCVVDARNKSIPPISPLVEPLFSIESQGSDYAIITLVASRYIKNLPDGPGVIKIKRVIDSFDSSRLKSIVASGKVLFQKAVCGV